ncbi:unnamed protein product [Oppiella nova]|uniref:Uncharacterized protein n=1 Tax=Oppiella nova TaxID=334625 RepID=A0A7R9M8B7_9ACAR|nr:unnamed protein product [Oppiella nova]CAG2172679.1 unnamed protein product [Oppiella nova]
MVRPPKIIVTDIDEDPDIKRQLRNREIKDWSGRPPKIIVTDIDEDPDIKRQLRNREIKDWSGSQSILKPQRNGNTLIARE